MNTRLKQLTNKEQPMRSKHSERYISSLIYVYCLLIGLCASYLIWGPGIINTRGGGDSPFLLQRTLDMAENIKHAAIPPRWMAHAAYEYGYPFFNHYGALPYYVSGGLTLVGFPITVAIQSTQTLGFVCAAFTMALWTKQLFKSQWAIVLSVTAYTFAPFHLVNVYVRGDSLSEFYAFVWFPLILWAIHRYVMNPSWGKLLTAACVYGGLLLTHNTSVVAFSPFALLYAIVISLETYGFPRNFHLSTLFFKYIAPTFLPFLLGMLLTAWFWLPAVAETGYGQLGSNFTEGYFHHSNHYRGLNLVQRSLSFDYSIALQVDDAGPFSMGLSQAIIALCGVFILLLLKSSQINIWRKIYLLLGLGLTTFIITPLSAFLWDNIPLLSIMQFPWRFLAVQSVFTAAVTSALSYVSSIHLLTKLIKTTPGSRSTMAIIQPIIAVSVIIILIWTTLAQLHPDRLFINSDDVTWDALNFYETFTGNIGTTIRHEYLPQNVVPRPYITQSIIDGTIHPKGYGNFRVDSRLLEHNPHSQRWLIEVKDDKLYPDNMKTVVFPLYWWPGWQARTGVSRISTFAFPGSGQLAINLPAGTHDIVLRLIPTQLQWFALVLSLSALVFVIFFSLYHSKKARSSWVKTPVFTVLALSLVSLLLPIIWHGSKENVGSYYDFDQMPYPHAGPVDFKLATLKASSISVDTAAPGDELEITMEWSLGTTEPITAVLRIVSPAEHRHNVSYALIETKQNLSPLMKTKIKLPDELSRGLYLIQLRLYTQSQEIKAKTAQNHTMGPLFIGTIRVPKGTKIEDTFEPFHTFKDINLHAINIHQSEPNLLKMELVWTTHGTPRNWSLSVRLLDSLNHQITQRDIQPGYGYLPTSIWRSDEYIYDYLQLEIPEGLAPGEYKLRIISYLQATMEVGGEVEIPVFIDKPTLYDLRNSCCEQTRKGATVLCEFAGIALLGVDGPASIMTSDRNLVLTSKWNAVQVPTSDIVTQWALINKEQEIVTSVAGPISAGSTTTAWPIHTWVSAPISIELDPLTPSGTYQLHLTLYDDTGLSEQCLIRDITINSVPRLYTIPAISHKQQVIFNNEIKLLGFELVIKKPLELAELTLWWQAEEILQRNYKRFVHLYEPKQNTIIYQDDAMPRNWTYPTTQWDKGEVISETITIPLADIPRGTYNLATGWYNPDSMIRLQVTEGDDVYIDDDRVTLSSPLKIR